MTRRSRLGFTTGDLVIVIAVLSILGGLVAPLLKGRAFNQLVEAALADVGLLVASAQRVRDSQGTWPRPGGPGDIPNEVAGSFAGDSMLVRDEYTLQWSPVDVVTQVEAPPVPVSEPIDLSDAPPDSAAATFVSVARTLGSVMVHSGNEDLLAELFARYGSEVSFVRDTILTVVIDTLGVGGTQP